MSACGLCPIRVLVSAEGSSSLASVSHAPHFLRVLLLCMLTSIAYISSEGAHARTSVASMLTMCLIHLIVFMKVRASQTMQSQKLLSVLQMYQNLASVMCASLHLCVFLCRLFHLCMLALLFMLVLLCMLCIMSNNPYFNHIHMP